MSHSSMNTPVAIHAALAPLAAPDDHVSLNGSAWIVSGKNLA